MRHTNGPIRVFVASPGDVVKERGILEEVIDDINHGMSSYGRRRRVSLELVQWQTHAHPSGDPPQDAINQQIGDYDIFIGIMWRRFGTPTDEWGSGTEEEYRHAYEGWRAWRKPDVMFYFSRAAAPPPDSVEEAEQLLAVVKFRCEIEEAHLVASYDTRKKFGQDVRRHLTNLLGKKCPPGAPRPHARTKKAHGRAAPEQAVVDEVIAAAEKERSLKKDIEREVTEIRRAIRSELPPANADVKDAGPNVIQKLFASSDFAARVMELMNESLQKIRTVETKGEGDGPEGNVRAGGAQR